MFSRQARIFLPKVLFFFKAIEPREYMTFQSHMVLGNILNQNLNFLIFNVKTEHAAP